MNLRNISAWCIRNPVPPIVLFVALLLAGIISFSRMDVNNNPDIEFPAAQVVIVQPGAAPTELEDPKPPTFAQLIGFIVAGAGLVLDGDSALFVATGDRDRADE